MKDHKLEIVRYEYDGENIVIKKFDISNHKEIENSNNSY